MTSPEEEFQARLRDSHGRVIRLPVRYQPVETTEKPVNKQVIASLFGTTTRTVDRWVSRDSMPKDTQYQRGCWIQVGGQRRYYPSRVREWLDER